jgi:hypothetical protein
MKLCFSIMQLFFRVIGCLFVLQAASISIHASAPGGEIKPAKPIWNCTEPVWLREPSFEDDVLIGRVASDCKVAAMNPASLDRLYAFIKKDVETSGRYLIHRPPHAATHEGVPGFRYDLTDKVQEDSDSLSIRQDMFLGLKKEQRLLYETLSTDVKAEGHASYLQKIVFRTEITPFHVSFENQVNVERPWYAFPPVLFRTVGKRITREKFLKARDELLRYFAPHI